MTTTATATKPITPRELAAIHAQWAKIDAGRCDERPSRDARLDFVSRVVMMPVSSTKDLSSDEALKVIAAMKQETGEEFKPVGYRGARRRQKGRVGHPTDAELMGIGRLAVELFGEHWEEMLEHRVRERFYCSQRDMTGGQHRSLVEELLNRIAVRNLADRHQPPFPRVEIEGEKALLRKQYFRSSGSQAVSQGAAYGIADGSGQHL